MTFLMGADGQLNWALVDVLLVVGLFLSAFYSGSETGFMSLSRVRLRRSGRNETAQGRAILDLLKNIEDPILTCLIGTNLFNVMVSAVLTVVMAKFFGQYGDLAAVAVGATLVITLGEILPKVIYREYPEEMTAAAVRGIRLSMLIFWPVRMLLLGFTALIRKAQPQGGDSAQESLDRRSLAALLMTNSPLNPDDQRFAKLMDRYLELEGISLGPIMRPLGDLVTVGPEATVKECLDTAAQHGFSRLPVTREDGQQIQAYVLVRDLLFLPREDHDKLIPRNLWRSFLLVDVRMSPYELFEDLRSRNAQLAMVGDPKGQLLGLITLEDLIETVIGSIHDEFDD